MKNSKKMRINKIISKQKSKKSKNNLRKKHITNKNNYRNKKRINKSIKYGGMQAANPISINLKMDDDTIPIMVNIGDNIYNSIKQALINKFPPHIPLRISFGGNVVDDHPDNTFELFGIEENSTILVNDDLVSFCSSRWKDINIPIQQYIEGLENPPLRDFFFTKDSIFTQLSEALNEPPERTIHTTQKILELIQRLTKETDPNPTLCETQIKLLDHNIILPSDEQLWLTREVDRLDMEEPDNLFVVLPLVQRIHELERLDLKNRLGSAPIPINVKMDDGIRTIAVQTIAVQKEDNIHETIKEASQDFIPPQYPLRISLGDEVVDDHPDNTFESFGIEPNCTLFVRVILPPGTSIAIHEGPPLNP